MLSYIIRRLFNMIPMLFGVSLLVFFLMYLAPGDFLTEARSRPDISDELVKQMEREYGLVDANGDATSWYLQYAYWINTLSPVKFIDAEGAFFSDIHWMREGESMSLGQSWAYSIPVTTLISQRLPATVVLSMTSVLLAWSLAIPLGVLAAMYKDSIWDRLSSLFAYAALSIPEFFLALLAVYFATITGWFPSEGLSSIKSDFMSVPMRLADYAWHLILPTLVLGLGSVAGMMRVMRANFLDYMRAEFVNTARAKGLSEGVVMFKHVLRNALNPLITSFGFAFSSLLSGSVIVESVMNYPGLGRLLLEAILRQDQHVVMAAALMGTGMLMLGNLLADLLLAWSDPRIRLEKSEQSSVPKRGLFRRLMPVLFVVIAFLMIDSVDWKDPETFPKLLELAKYVIGSIFVLVILFVLKSSWKTIVGIFKSLPSRPLGFCAAILLLSLYCGALLAPFFATHTYKENNLGKTYHPPTALTWENGLAVRLYENVDPSAAQYEPVQDAVLPLKWFAEGFEYKLLGLIPMRTHLLQADYDALEEQLGHKIDPKDYPVYLLGSDSVGRDVFSRLLYGSRVSLTIGLLGIAITMTMGFIVGALSGYFGGQFDFWAMRLVEFLMALPGLYLLLALRGALAPHFDSGEMFIVIVGILAMIGWAGTARIIRGMSLSLRNRTFVVAAESMGQRTDVVLFRHILPHLSSYLLVAATLSIPAYILGESNLSFLGLGIQEPSASWGLMLKQAQEMKVFMLNFWWMLLPGLLIFLTVIAYNLLGDALRDIVDPKMKM